MRLLFSLDAHNYAPGGSVATRKSARAIVVRRGKLSMIYSRVYHYYKFPGGGMEAGETPLQALARELREEAGLLLLPETVRPYGYVHRVQRGKTEDRFVQNNLYFFCDTAEEALPPCLDPEEQEEGFVPLFVDPALALETNRSPAPGPKDRVMLERETRVLELLLAEGVFAQNPPARP